MHTAQTPISTTNAASPAPTKESKFSLLLGEISENPKPPQAKQSSSNSNILKFFSAKNLFAKLIPHQSQPHELEETKTAPQLKTPGQKPPDLDVEFMILELAHLLVSNAILKATNKITSEIQSPDNLVQSNNKIHEINQLSLNETESIHQISMLTSPLSDIEETGSEFEPSLNSSREPYSGLSSDSSMFATPRLAYNLKSDSFPKQMRKIHPTLVRKKRNMKNIYKTLNTKNLKDKSICAMLTSPSAVVTRKPPLPPSASSASSQTSQASSSSFFRSNKELLDSFSLNMHRIDKDVARCDRNHWYFTNNNLKKLQNIIYTYVFTSICGILKQGWG